MRSFSFSRLRGGDWDVKKLFDAKEKTAWDIMNRAKAMLLEAGARDGDFLIFPKMSLVHIFSVGFADDEKSLADKFADFLFMAREPGGNYIPATSVYAENYGDVISALNRTVCDAMFKNADIPVVHLEKEKLENQLRFICDYVAYVINDLQGRDVVDAERFALPDEVSESIVSAAMDKDCRL